ncbi:MAG TPA: SPFH domain-containing protein [bacterium]|nr:SPFH domain-containing protein [bacterium]
MYRENHRKVMSGWLPLVVGLAVMAYCIYLIITGPVSLKITGAVVALLDFIFLTGLFMVNPNEGRVMQLFGKYVGTAKEEGLRWANPFYTKRRISLRVRNFETARMKVNDTDGNPVEIAAIVVWKVVDTAEASFHVDNYERFVEVQSESAVRNMATNYPYDSHEDGVVSLRGNTAQISEHLKKEIQDRLAQAGVEVIEARISHLAYAPEIAEVMLRRQQAGAIVAARQKIVEGAVGMVEMALKRLSEHAIVNLDEERKAQMVSNMLVVLCGDRGAQPVVNAGSIYQ